MIGDGLLKDFDPRTRRWLKVSFFGGIAFLFVCSCLDVFSWGFVRDWWHGLGYSLNILASLTGFLIDLPVAVVVIDKFKSNLADKLQI